MPNVLVEAVLVTTVGLSLALVANQVSPRGLVLGRDYFPALPVAPGPSSSGPATNSATPGTNGADGTNAAPSAATLAGRGGGAVEARLRALQIKSMTTEEVEALFRDARYAQEQVVFVDARDDRHFQAGHIPGAHLFDRFYPERYLPSVLPRVTAAEVVVVYCTGGDCEDSVFAAGLLRDAGVGAERLAVYTGGITEWSQRGLPIEVSGSADEGVPTPRPP